MLPQASQENTALQLALIARLQGQPVELSPITGLQLEHQPAPEFAPPAPQPLHDYEACLHRLLEEVAKVFVLIFAEVDTYPVRVRLPDEPLLLCHRIMDIEGEALSMGPGRIITEHDASGCLVSRWRALAGFGLRWRLGKLIGLVRLAGHRSSGQRRSCLSPLDATVTFHREISWLGRGDDAIRHPYRSPIRRHPAVLHYDGFIGEERLISMRDGCAGFFQRQRWPEMSAPGERGRRGAVAAAPRCERAARRAVPPAGSRSADGALSGSWMPFGLVMQSAAFGAAFTRREIALDFAPRPMIECD